MHACNETVKGKLCRKKRYAQMKEHEKCKTASPH